MIQKLKALLSLPEHAWGAAFWLFLSASRISQFASITQCVILGSVFEIWTNLSFLMRFGRLDGDVFSKIHHVATIIASFSSILWFSEKNPIHREGARNLLYLADSNCLLYSWYAYSQNYVLKIAFAIHFFLARWCIGFTHFFGRFLPLTQRTEDDKGLTLLDKGMAAFLTLITLLDFYWGFRVFAMGFRAIKLHRGEIWNALKA